MKTLAADVSGPHQLGLAAAFADVSHVEIGIDKKKSLFPFSLGRIFVIFKLKRRKSNCRKRHARLAVCVYI